MAGTPWTEAEEANLRQMCAAGKTVDEMGAATGRGRHSINSKCRSLGLSPVNFYDKARGEAATQEAQQEWSVEERDGGNTCEIASKSHDVQTVEDALRKANVDTAVWAVDRFVVNSWEVAAKVKDGDGNETMQTRPLWQVKVWLKRKVSKVQEDVAHALIERMKKHSPKYETPKYLKVKARPTCALEISLFDAHFGKLAWHRETGEDYDLRIAEEVYRNAVKDLLNHTSGYNVDRIIYPIGSDFFHINNAANTTKAGTPQDVDGRLAKVYLAGCMAVVNAIDHCVQVAPVEGIWTGGNHDMETSWFMAQYLQAWYRNSKRVTIDAEPKTRKYRELGVNLLGFVHGDKERLQNLPTLMASEVPQAWARSKHREFHVGHKHKAHEIQTVTVDGNGPIRVRTLPSLSATDKWHYEQGYVGGLRAAEAYLWDYKDGYVGHFSAAARRN